MNQSPNNGRNEMMKNLDKCRNIDDAPLINILLAEGVNVFRGRWGCAVWAVGQFDHMTKSRKLFNDKHHFCWQDISLIHLKTDMIKTLHVQVVRLLFINSIMYIARSEYFF